MTIDEQVPDGAPAPTSFPMPVDGEPETAPEPRPTNPDGTLIPPPGDVTPEAAPEPPAAPEAAVNFFAAAQPAESAAATLKEGSSGDAVKELQKLLTEKGFPVTNDGHFGPATGAACVAAKKALGYPEAEQLPIAGARLLKKLEAHPPIATPAEFAMFDSVTVSEIPADAEAVAGYVGGNWPTFATLVKEFPHAKRLSVAVNADEDAECLDVERGDAINDQAAAWVKRQHAAGVKLPVVYTSVSNVTALLEDLQHSGIERADIRLWTAHYTDVKHRCSHACGYGMSTVADATQWTDRASGKNLDLSLCAGDFL